MPFFSSQPIAERAEQQDSSDPMSIKNNKLRERELSRLAY